MIYFFFTIIFAIAAVFLGILSSVLGNDIKDKLKKNGIPNSVLYLTFVICLIGAICSVILTTSNSKDQSSNTISNANVNSHSTSSSQENANSRSTTSNNLNNNSINDTTVSNMLLNNNSTSNSKSTNTTTNFNSSVQNTTVKTPTPPVIPTPTPTVIPTIQPTVTPVPIKELYVGKTCWSKNSYNARQEPNESPNNLTGYRLDKPSRGGPKVKVVDAVKGTDRNIWLLVKVNGDIVGWFKLYYFAECVAEP